MEQHIMWRSPSGPGAMVDEMGETKGGNEEGWRVDVGQGAG